MYALLVIALSTLILPPCNCVEVPDVTTIYDVKNLCEPVTPYFHSVVDSEEVTTERPKQRNNCSNSVPNKVYKRTNALGLDLFLNERKYESVAEPSEPNWSCDTGSSCDWEFTGWTDGEFGVLAKDHQTYPILKDFSIKFSTGLSPSYRNHEIMLVFTETDKNIRDHHRFHLMYLFCPRTYYYYGCYYTSSSAGWNVIDRDGVIINIYCNNYYSSGYDIYFNSSLKIEYGDYNGNVKVFANGSSSALMDWNSGSKMKFVTTYFYQRPNFMKLNVMAPAKTSTENGSTIVSPAFVLSSKNICLTLVLNCSADTKSNVLRISAVDPFQIEHVLFDVNNLKAGWQVKHVNIEIANEISSPFKLTIRKVNPVELQIQRISSCSSRGLEVVRLPHYTPGTSSEWKTSAPVYIATSEALPLIEKVPDVSGSCLNGGVMTTSGCACPPGFTGVNCQIGCGKSKIGQDCRGKCSLRSRGCKGFLVCSPFVECKCAPGYDGFDCQTECPGGLYGNDCKQRCGHCAGGKDCDRFTGECESCNVGYLPPYCQQEYVYYSLQPSLVSEKYKTITVSFDLREGVKGIGEAKLYQIQYREKDDLEWHTYTIKTIPKADSVEVDPSKEESQIKETIDGLKVGILYNVRVLLLDASFNKYDGDLVKSAQVLSKCDNPLTSVAGDFDYKVQGSSNESAFTFTWNYELSNDNWCPVEIYEVSWSENGEWMTNMTLEPIYTLTDFDQGSTVEFKVRVKTTGGFAPYSKTTSISTEESGMGSVKDLRMVSSQSTGLDISWSSPPGSEDLQLKYTVTFKCVNQVACSPGCDDAIEGQLTQEETSVTLSGLQPFTQYLVTVTPENGPQSKLYVGTAEAVPTEAPELGKQKTIRSNSSITVFWEPVSVCSSFLNGYTYQLTKAAKSMKLLASGFTKDTSMSFYNLTASSDYVVKVFINTEAGWNPDVFLAINVSTSATVPDAVQNLTVYKIGRTMLGLRWMDPKNLYGELKSFTVQYSLGKDVISETVMPSQCVVWPEYYCHTLENLKSNRKYNIMVSARNVDMPEDGAVASLTTNTKESAPLPPEDLKVLNRTSTSVSLQWKHPSLINGVLRSFLVNVEESEKYDQDSCCQDYPLVEIQVKEERMYYEVEVSGLHPASTYYLSVSAKTVSMGLSQSLVVSTRPPHLAVSVLPMWSSLTEIDDLADLKEVEWLSQENISQVNNSDLFTPLTRAHVLLITTNDSKIINSTSKLGIKEEQFLNLLNDAIPGPAWFITEYNIEGAAVPEESEWGEYPADFFVKGVEYQLIAVQISDYNGVYNIDMRYSSPFVYGT